MEKSCPRIYKPRRPSETPLFKLLESSYESVKLVWEERFEARDGFWQGCWDDAVARYLDCCSDCRYEMLVAFSCYLQLKTIRSFSK